MSNIAKKVVLGLYDLAWRLAIPALRKNRRLAEGFDQRILGEIPGKSDLWIQAASAGESYLAWSLIKNLAPPRPIRILLTSGTRQGMGILDRAISDITPNSRGVTVTSAYFPFDRPAIMETAVRNIRPKVMVLLELELWPGLLSALKKYNCNIFIINGRITLRSLKRYQIWPSLWRFLRPDRVLAISENDAKRFSALFGSECVEVMPNIKFDRISDASADTENPLGKIFPPDHPRVVLGSVRREEEPLIEKIILRIRDRHPEAVISLFPRHIHRIKHWGSALDRLSVPWVLRSGIGKNVPCGTIILWDTFGELSSAYELATAAYVGGGLAPLGGQNFLEAVTSGVIPVIGPFWENFAWVGQEIVEQGLVQIAGDWKEAADMLIEMVENPQSHKEVCDAALRYVKDRQGGTHYALWVVGCQL